MSNVFETTPRTSDRSLLIGLLAGPVIWAVHFLVVYVISESVCMGGQLPFPLISTTVILIAVVLVTLAAMSFVVWMGLRSYRLWTAQSYNDSQGAAIETDKRTPFLALSGFL